ncbi:hypothetical protein PUN28_018473 [Cardiocondyla obscurior]|uniref:Uncharacterized protein n=1 Tax=Cardiocondyla obscurior TaxID=286306 RepID=A0AAW2EJE2_9HYME
MKSKSAHYSEGKIEKKKKVLPRQRCNFENVVLPLHSHCFTQQKRLHVRRKTKNRERKKEIKKKIKKERKGRRSYMNKIPGMKNKKEDDFMNPLLQPAPASPRPPVVLFTSAVLYQELLCAR